MDSEKQGSSSSDSSSEEQSDRCDPVKEDSDSFRKRSYGCIFCKRGFTNAQALGGHMNIHRKDRANKAKQITSSYSSSSPPPSKEVDQSTITNNPYLVPVSLMYCPSAMEVQMNYRPLAPNPHGEVSHWFIPRSSRGLNMNQELWGSDLSLQIRPTDDLGRMGVCNGDGVDLELRLGHDP